MTDNVFRSARLLLALCLSLAAVVSNAQDESTQNSLGTFGTPTYPGNTLQRAAAGQLGQQQGVPSSAIDAQRTRALQNNTGQNTQDGRVRSLDPNSPNYNNGLNRPFDLAPPKPGEFQKFVEAATGRLLPLFGSRFFADAFNNRSSVDNVPVSADYTVGPGDEIVIRAWGSIDVDYRTTVDRNGLLNLPKIGSFNVSGVKAADLEKQLRAQIGRLYTNFELSVSLGQLRGLKVFVVGPAQRPGVFNLPSQSTILSAVVMAGGPSPTGSMRKVSLRRDGKIISELDIYDFLVQGDKSKDLQLAAGDVVVFQPAGPRVALNGALDTPAIYELKSAQEPVGEVLRYAGGTPTLANPNRAQLERIDASQPKAPRFVEEFKLDPTGLQKAMRDGDVLTLLAISPEFANAVTLRGHVAQPLRYPFKPGMRIRDLIPDRDALITPDFYRRKNLLVQVIDDDEDTRGGPNSRNNGSQNGSSRNNQGRSTTNATNTYSGASGAAAFADRGNGNGNGNNNVDAYGYANNSANGNDNNNYNDDNGNANGGRNNDGYGNYDQDRNSSQMSRTDRNRRAQDRQLVSDSKRSPVPLFDELNWDYAVIERLNLADLTTLIIPFNLGKVVLQGDEVNNILLMPGDVVTIYSQKDIRVPVARQTRLVSLEGEVGAPGVYQLQPGETLKGLVARAGGFTPQAYIYGLDFSREETRQRQRENLTAAIARLETLSSVQSARDAANRRDDPAGAATTAAVSNAAAQAQLSRLRNVQPTGRIALELDPDVKTAAALPDVPLEAGDRIVVPPRPGFVTVAGAVVNSNAFLWKPGRTAGEYLKLAGADEAAEPDNMFILRADGTVKHAGDTRGFFGSTSLESQVMQPGDALIVPNQLDFETWGRAFVRNLKDFAQIFTGFGIGIAAIHSL